MVPRRRLRRGPDHPACVVASTPYRLPASSPRRRFIETRLRRPVVLSPRRRSRPFWPASRAAGCRERRVTSLDSARLRGDHPGKAPAASQKQGQRIAESHATSDILAGRCPPGHGNRPASGRLATAHRLSTTPPWASGTSTCTGRPSTGGLLAIQSVAEAQRITGPVEHCLPVRGCPLPSWRDGLRRAYPARAKAGAGCRWPREEAGTFDSCRVPRARSRLKERERAAAGG
jgi:hypothetical protein